MKIRIKGDSVRYRLVKSEVRLLQETGKVIESIHFPSQELLYILEAKDGINELSTDFVGNTITVYMPKIEADIWYDTDRITYKNSIHLPNGNSLSILVEKDFVCLDHTDEDQSDNYANPNTHC
jgi:hypothetical protein